MPAAQVSAVIRGLACRARVHPTSAGGRSLHHDQRILLDTNSWHYFPNTDNTLALHVKGRRL